jgi:protein ImuB
VAIVAVGRLGADQGDLLAPTWHDPSAAEAAFARLRAELGPHVVVRPALRDAHRPERAGAWEDDLAAAPPPTADPSVPALPTAERPPEDTPPLRDEEGPAPDVALARAVPATERPGDLAASLRLLEHPEPCEVTCDAAAAPVVVRWRGARWTVAHADGPERLSGDWWNAPYRRDYWRCATAAGLLLVYAAAPDGWYVQGWYD